MKKRIVKNTIEEAKTSMIQHAEKLSKTGWYMTDLFAGNCGLKAEAIGYFSRMKSLLTTDMIKEIRESDVNPATYNTPLYNDIEEHMFSGDVPEKFESDCLQETITKIWQGK